MTQDNAITPEKHIGYLEDLIEHLSNERKDDKFFIKNLLTNLARGVLEGEIEPNHYLRAILTGNINVKYRQDLDKDFMKACE